jgi:hypothetical protein
MKEKTESLLKMICPTTSRGIDGYEAFYIVGSTKIERVYERDLEIDGSAEALRLLERLREWKRDFLRRR